MSTRRPPPAPGRRRRYRWLVVGLVVAASACALNAESSPRRIAKSSVPFGLLEPTSTAATTTAAESERVGVYLVQNAKLARVERSIRTSVSLRAALDALMRGPTEAQREAGYGSAIPPGVKVRGVQVDGDVAEVDLGGTLAETGAGQQPLAIAQVVFTATDQPGITRVRLRLNGLPVAVPRADGTLTADPVGRVDYAPFAL